MSENLTKEAFEENLNSNFRVTLSPDQVVDLVLYSVNEIMSTPRQEQFAVTFHGPLDVPFNQGMRTIDHEKMGNFVLFLVPIGKEKSDMIYEAVFNRFKELGRQEL